MARSETSAKKLRRLGMRRIAGLLDELRAFDELNEARPGVFHHGRTPFLHFHYRTDGSIRADVRLSKRGFTEIDASDDAGQQEVLLAVAKYLGS